MIAVYLVFVFMYNAITEFYTFLHTLSLHDALPFLPGFREVLVAYMSRREKLVHKLLPIYAAALGKAPDFFHDKFDRADISSRFGHYPPGDGNDPNEFGAAPHADAGFLTLLPQAEIGRAHV